MPKLSSYIVDQQQQQQQQQQAAETSSSGSHQEPQGCGAGVGTQEQLRQGGRVSHELPPKYAAACSKLRGEYEKRLENHGPRVFRWPDGKLRPEMPPTNPYTAANRQKWEQLVKHCRTRGGGDRSYEKNGYSLRYGIGVENRDHEAYLALIGLEPEIDAAGQQRGWQQGGVQNPLDDPGHCFNTFYKEGAAAVFKYRRGRLL